MKEESSLDFVISEIEVIYRPKVKPSERPQVLKSDDAYYLFLKGWDMDKIYLVEHAKVMLLNHSNRVLGIHQISSGSISGTIIDPKQVFSVSLKTNACNIILAHNHPSGNLQFSYNDISLTRKLISAGSFLEIKVLDHLILSPEGYRSFENDIGVY